MKETDLHNIVYSKDVIEFVTVANEFCNYLESFDNVPLEDVLSKLQKFLPLLYLKGSLLPIVESAFDETNEKFVTEQDWDFINDKLKNIIKSADEYLEVFDKRMNESDTPVISSISENIADIYQDLKDFLMLYRIGTIEFMNDAIWECVDNYKIYWGQKTVNVLRAIHHLLYNFNFDQFDEPINKKNEAINKNNWIISKRQQDYLNDEQL